MPFAGAIPYPPVDAVLRSNTGETRTPHFPDKPESQLPKQHWCWAAVCQSVYWGYKSHVDQKYIVLKCDPDKIDDDDGFNVHYALSGILGFEVENLSDGDLYLLVPENCIRYPVPIIIKWDSDGGLNHAVCAIGTGHVDGQPALLLYDPLPADKSATGSDLIKLVPVSAFDGHYLEGTNAAARGRWVEAYAVTGYAG